MLASPAKRSRDEKLRHREISLPARARARVTRPRKRAASPRSVSRASLAMRSPRLAGLDADDFPLARAFFTASPSLANRGREKKAGLPSPRGARARTSSRLAPPRSTQVRPPSFLASPSRAPPRESRPARRVASRAFRAAVRPGAFRPERFAKSSTPACTRAIPRVRRPRETRAAFDARPPRPPPAPDADPHHPPPLPLEPSGTFSD